MFNLICNWILASLPFATVLMFGTMGEILTQKSGNMNLGVEGIMYMGGAFGLLATYSYEQVVGSAAANPVIAVVIAVVSSFAAGCLASLIFSFLTVSLRANQNVVGLALTIFGTGVGQFTGELMRTTQGAGGFVALGDKLKGVFAHTVRFGKNNALIYEFSPFFILAIAIAICMHLFLQKTKKGLYLRAVGESPATADSAGINITAYKYIATITGGGISAIGGMVYIMTCASCVWNHEGLSGVGWLAVALVIFCTWKPLNALWGSVLFGTLMRMYQWITKKNILLYAFGYSIDRVATVSTGRGTDEIYKVLPYIVTIIVLVISSIRNKNEKQPPASLGLNYFREDR